MKQSLLRQLCIMSKYAIYGLFIQTVLFTTMLANNAVSQNESIEDIRVSVEFNNDNIETAFNKIEDLTGFYFAYKKNIVSRNVKLDKKINDESIANVLRYISKNSKLKFKRVGKNILVTKIIKDNPGESNVEEVFQTKTVSGKIVSQEDGKGLPGVNVLIKGTATGTVTDIDGNYTLEVPSNNAVLVYSSVGFVSEEVAVGNQSVINLSMVPDITALEEIVVVGFGEQSAITTTGAISSVSGDEIQKTSSPTIAEAITGKAPGLATVQITGEPGASDPDLYLRGIGTMNNSDPLIIIDGVPSTKRAFMQLNPSDVADLSILKDASSTAVYGVRGANGAIIVNTRRGKAGEMRIQADVSYGTQVPTALPQYGNAYEWATNYNQTLLNDGDSSNLIPASDIRHYRDQDQPLLYPDNNWVDQVFGNSAMQSRSNISISGGTEDVRYFTSIGYFKQDGLLKIGNNTGDFTYDRYNLRTNLDMNITPTTEIKFTSSARIGVKQSPLADKMSAFWRRVNTQSPVSGAGIIDGKLILPREFYAPYVTNRQPVISDIYGKGSQLDTEQRLNINMEVTQDLDVLSPVLEGLKFRTKMGYRAGFNENIDHHGGGFATYYSMYNVDTRNPNPNLADSAIVLQKTGEPGNEYWEHDYYANRYIYWEAGLDYEKTINDDHNISALLIYQQNKDYYPNDVEYDEIPTGYVGVSGRLRYDYSLRYILEFNVGYNGSENFAKDNRFGWFPSVSAGWVISEEPFMRNVGIIDHLKIRGSYGLVGADQTSAGERFIYIGNLYDRNVSQYYGNNFGNNIPEYRPGVHEDGVGNSRVTWETAEKQNYGIEMKFLDRRLSLSANYFYEYRNDILMYRNSAPTWLSIELPALNIGEMENRGYELEMGWNDQIGDFSYNIDGNFSYAKNNVLYMDEVPPREPYQTMTGHPLNTNYGYIWEGFYTAEEIEMIENGQLAKPTAANVKAGDMRYKDLNGDNIIDEADQKPFGYPSQPQMTGGLNLSLGYKGFDLSMGMQGATQVSRNLGNVFKDPFGTIDEYAILKTFVDHSWTPERAEAGTAKWPRHTFENDDYNNQTSTFWNRNSSYLRIRRVELGYTFDASILRSLGVSQMRVYVNGNNLYTWSHSEFTMMDPERSPGQTTGYPIIKTYNAGLNITF